MLPIKIVLYCANFIFLVGGGCLVVFGLGITLNDEVDNMLRLIPTSLPNSLTYYVSVSSAILGLATAGLALIAFFSLATVNRYLLAGYIFGMVVMLIVECTAIVFLAVTPKFVGIHVDSETLIDKWQRNYGVPGREHYTASVDLIQTKWNCCGVENGMEYTTSWWSLRELASPGLVVPLSCCVQSSNKSYLDPEPSNVTLCQDKNPEAYKFGRHIDGCFFVAQKLAFSRSGSSFIRGSHHNSLSAFITFSLYYRLFKIKFKNDEMTLP